MPDAALIPLWTIANLTTPVDLSPLHYAKLLLTLTAGVVPFVMIGAALVRWLGRPSSA